MGVMMQGFYWNCPREEGREFRWWNHVRSKVPELSAAGFTSLWLPPLHKAANLNGPSMGYDPYDYYDLGEFDQKGGIPTWFGTKEELFALIEEAHAGGLEVFTDLVLGHNSGGDERERNPLTGEERWTLFRPASGRFTRNWESFRPNRYEEGVENPVGDMPVLSHRNPRVFAEIMELVGWLVEEIGLDGFRHEPFSGSGAATIAAIQEYLYMRNGGRVRPFGMTDLPVEASYSTANPVRLFDARLRGRLKGLCDHYGFNLRDLAEDGCLMREQPGLAVTFVEHHDLRREGQAVTHDKLLAYSFILTHEGTPCVFWKDYFKHALGMDGTPHGIAALVRAWRQYAGGGTKVLHVDDDLYMMQREGEGEVPGLVYVLNNRGLGWNGAWVDTAWRDTRFLPAAWWSRTDMHRPGDQRTGPDGRGEFYAPPRGYVVYVPEG